MEGLKINREQQVVYTNKEDAYVITRRDWTRIKKNISKLNKQTSVWSNVFWGSLGIGVSCIVSWLANLKNVVPLVCGATGLCTAVCALFASKSEAKHYQAAIDNIHEIIADIEDYLVPNKEEEK